MIRSFTEILESNCNAMNLAFTNALENKFLPNSFVVLLFSSVKLYVTAF